MKEILHKPKKQKQPSTAKPPKRTWGTGRSTKGKAYRCRLRPGVQAQVLGMYLTNHKQRQIARTIGIDRESVARIVSQQENQILLSGYRQAVMKIVPAALIQAYELVERGDRQMVTDVLYGSRVFVQRQEIEKVEERKRTYAYPKAEFYMKHGRWPSLKEAIEFDKTITVPLLTKGEVYDG